MKRICYGIGRSRDRKGKVVDQHPLPYTMCIHTNVGGGWETMQVLVMELIEYGDKSQRGSADPSEHKQP